jgi:hypothetical protein
LLTGQGVLFGQVPEGIFLRRIQTSLEFRTKYTFMGVFAYLTVLYKLHCLYSAE